MSVVRCLVTFVLGCELTNLVAEFVELTGWPVNATPPTLDTISALVVHADNAVIADLRFPTTGKADILNKLQENIVRSLLSNMHSVESDCPTRERVGWTGDSQATAETAVMSLDMRGFWAKWLQDYEDAQCPGKPGCDYVDGIVSLPPGALSSTIPYGKHTPPVDPSWPTSYCQETMLLYKYFGDKQVMRDRFDSIRRYVDFLPTPKTCPSCHTAPGGQAGQTHCPGHPELPWYYMNGDWMEWEAQPDELSQSGPLLSSYHYILDVTLLGEMAAILGKDDLAAKYNGMAAKLWVTFNDVYLRLQDPPPSPPSATCDEQKELRKGGHEIVLSCHSGVIDRVLFAALGTPTGSCDSGFVHNATCDAPGVKENIDKLCIGKASCTMACEVGRASSVGVFTDPCTGTIKSLAVKVHCNGTAPPAPAPPPTRPLYGYATPGQAPGQVEQVVMLGRRSYGEWSGSSLIPDVHYGDVAQTFLNNVKAANNHITTGFIGNKYAWPSLTNIGQAELALEIALSTTSPSYGYQIVNGATTLWEDWSGGDIEDTLPEKAEGVRSTNSRL